MTGADSSAGSQLPLHLPHRPSFARADFLVGAANREALAVVDAWPDWPSPSVLLAGPAGCGKSHLAEIWREKAHGVCFSAPALAGSSPPPDVSAVVIEDIDRAASAEALFHVINRVREAGAFLLLTSREAAPEAFVSLPDLVSRLRAARPVAIGAPDDELLRAVLVKLFADRQLAVQPPVVDYLVRRIERSLETVGRVVDALDRRALSQGRAVTRPLAAEILADTGLATL